MYGHERERREGEACECVGDDTALWCPTGYFEPFYKSTGFLISSKLFVSYCYARAILRNLLPKKPQPAQNPRANVPEESMLGRGP